ncbi:Tyrosine-protein kinase CSK, partial [Operophtera brumata]
HGVHGGPPGVGPCGWYAASASPAPTAPARLKRAQPPHQLPCGGSASGSNGQHAPLSPTALQNSISHNSQFEIATKQCNMKSVLYMVIRSASLIWQDSMLCTLSQRPTMASDIAECFYKPHKVKLFIPPVLAYHDTEWHHGSISRERAEALLSASPDGVFLVRESTNFPGDHTLCVRFRGRVEHYRIIYKTPTQPPPYPPTPSVPAAHFQHTYSQQAPAADQTDSSLSQNFIDARWKIDERDLEIRENIGKGEFGDVMLGILNGTKVAVKILKDQSAASKFRAEASIMATCIVTEHCAQGSLLDYLRSRGRHYVTQLNQINFAYCKHNLVRLLGLVFAAGSTCIVTEHCAQGSLLDYLRSRGRHYVTQLNQINFAYDACCGMEYLERGRIKFSNKSDMWSFGILLWEIYSFGRVPYPRIPLAEVVRHVERGYRMEAPEGCPPGSYEVMRAAWHADPAQRPTFAATRLRLAVMRDQARAMPQPQLPPIHQKRYRNKMEKERFCVPIFLLYEEDDTRLH